MHVPQTKHTFRVNVFYLMDLQKLMFEVCQERKIYIRPTCLKKTCNLSRVLFRIFLLLLMMKIESERAKKKKKTQAVNN
jgi:hypothetical protein